MNTHGNADLRKLRNEMMAEKNREVEMREHEATRQRGTASGGVFSSPIERKRARLCIHASLKQGIEYQRWYA